MKKELFSLDHISFAYSGTEVLRDITCTIHEGEKIAIIGANGSGKSTLLKLFDGLQFPSAGTLSFKGEALTESYFKNIQHEYAFRRQVGFVFQDPDVQLFNQTVLDEVRFGPLQMGLTISEVDSHVSKAMEMVSIMHLADRSPFTLSGGEKKRVSLASILSMQPSVWLMDEPLSSLDPRSQSHVIDFMNESVHRGESVIITTHDILLLQELANRVLVISEDHRLVADTTPSKLLKEQSFLLEHNLVHNHSHAHGGNSHSHKHIHSVEHSHIAKK